MSNTTTTPHTIEAFNRGQHTFLSTKEVRQLVKNNLGYNARQVSIKKPHSIGYIDVTIRDPKVDIQRVRDFFDKLSTWHMSMDDYCSGQSFTVSVTIEVWEVATKEWLPTIKSMVAEGKMGGDTVCKINDDIDITFEDEYLYVNYPTGSIRVWAEYTTPLGIAKLVYDASQK